MATLQIRTSDFMLQSTWKCTLGKIVNGKDTGPKLPSGQPTKATRTVTFAYSLPSGVAITSSKVWATITGMYTGYSLLTVNGNGFKYRNGNEYGADVLLTETSGGISVTFAFKANGNTADLNQHISSTMFSNIYLAIEYEGGHGESEIQGSQDTTKFSIPPQAVCIYHQTTGKVYMFDGVTKVGHNFSVSLDEEKTNSSGTGPDKDKWINNAKNEPDKLSLDVMMSDVYTDEGNMTLSTGWDDALQQQAYNASNKVVISDFTRSGNAARVLHRLKESREKISVITPQYVHVDMILSGVTINQDENCPFGWIGSLEFQHAFKPKVKTDYGKNKDTGSKMTEAISIGQYKQTLGLAKLKDAATKTVI